MRQSFEVRGGAGVGRSHAPKIRARLKAAKIDGVYIPHEDEYQNEYLPACNDRLAWATGFTGSAGAAFIFKKQAIVFVDGRYTLQAKDQLDAAIFEQADLMDPGPFGWLAAQSLPGAKIAYDPRVISPNALERLRAAADKAGADLVGGLASPVDEAWTDRPAEPLELITPHDVSFAGRTSADKRADLAGDLTARGVDAVVLVSPASIAWLLNIRGGDVACTPLPLGRAILYADGRADLFVRPEKAGADLGGHLGEDVQIRPISELERRLSKLGGQTVSLDPNLASAWFFQTLEAAGAEIVREPDPCALPRACKNSVEIAGAKRAHQRDGVALVHFLRWLDTEGQSGKVTEIDAVKKLESLREETQALRDLSFEAIAGAGPNGAVVHYRVSEATNRKLARGTLFLVDSGGQYLDGTTDVTRTVAIGEPTEEMREAYTRVLRGHIALATVKFPKGTTGASLDALARAPLWEAGLDYDHGTGHGVGSFLGVHEGPQRISKSAEATPLQPGMIVSNEPGYYKTGAFGIRIENLQFVAEPHTPSGGEREMMTFEALTLAPLDRRLIETGLLSEREWVWVDRYHARVLAELSPRLDAETKAWLSAACAPL